MLEFNQPHFIPESQVPPLPSSISTPSAPRHHLRSFVSAFPRFLVSPSHAALPPLLRGTLWPRRDSATPSIHNPRVISGAVVTRLLIPTVASSIGVFDSVGGGVSIATSQPTPATADGGQGRHGLERHKHELERRTGAAIPSQQLRLAGNHAVAVAMT